MQQFLTGISDL